MSMKLTEKDEGKVMEVQVSGKLSAEDYKEFVPEFERRLQGWGRLRVLFDMVDFHGWNAGALWQDIKFDLKHFGDIERVAMVGDKKWEKGMCIFCRPFTRAKVRYFDHDHTSEAHTWVAAELGQIGRGNSGLFRFDRPARLVIINWPWGQTRPVDETNSARE